MEKQELAHVERINTNHSTSLHGEELKKEHTLRNVDLENRNAFKGDDSDGKIEWTVRKILASAFLAMLYTGMMFIETTADLKILKKYLLTHTYRLADPSLLRRRES